MDEYHKTKLYYQELSNYANDMKVLSLGALRMMNDPIEMMLNPINLKRIEFIAMIRNYSFVMFMNCLKKI